ncbi:CAP domain-containing protein [Actinomyces bowdenii]
MIKRAIAAAVLAAAPLALASPAVAVQAEPPAAVGVRPSAITAEGAGYAQTVLDKVNELRASQGLQPVTRFVELDNVAQGWTEQMAAGGFLEHNPSFSQSYPAGWSGASENIATTGGPSSTADVGTMMFELWLNSPGHYKNMVDPDANAIGIGFALDSKGSWYATQNFAAYSDTSSLTQTGGSNGGSTGTTPPDTTTPPAPPTSQQPPAPPTTTAPAPTPSTSAPAAPPTTESAPPATPSAPATETTAPAPSAPSTTVQTTSTSTQTAGAPSVPGVTASASAPVVTAGGSTPGGPTLANTGTSIAAALIAQALIGAGLFLMWTRRRRHS